MVSSGKSGTFLHVFPTWRFFRRGFRLVLRPKKYATQGKSSVVKSLACIVPVQRLVQKLSRENDEACRFYANLQVGKTSKNSGIYETEARQSGSKPQSGQGAACGTVRPGTPHVGLPGGRLGFVGRSVAIRSVGCSFKGLCNEKPTPGALEGDNPREPDSRMRLEGDSPPNHLTICNRTFVNEAKRMVCKPREGCRRSVCADYPPQVLHGRNFRCMGRRCERSTGI